MPTKLHPAGRQGLQRRGLLGRQLQAGVMDEMTAREQIQEIQKRVNASVIGQERVVERLVIALLANGNVLIEGLPGLAKTRAIKSLARTSNPISAASSSRPTCCPRT